MTDFLGAATSSCHAALGQTLSFPGFRFPSINEMLIAPVSFQLLEAYLALPRRLVGAEAGTGTGAYQSHPSTLIWGARVNLRAGGPGPV